MKKVVFQLMMLMAVITASAQYTSSNMTDKEVNERYDYLDEYAYINVDSILREAERAGMMQRLSQTYSEKYYKLGLLMSHWFVGGSLHGCVSIGNPKGCGDLYDRKSLAYGVYLGKWHSPFVGTRLTFQNGYFKDAYMGKHVFQAYHADLMYNVTNHLLAADQSYRRWDVIPYLGVGLMNGARLVHEDCPCDACNGRNNAFMLAYGVQGRYRATSRLYITAELGGLTSFNDMDGYGSRHRFGDNILSGSVGIAVDLGRNKWSRAVDAKPYIAQNDYLINNYMVMRNANRSLYNMHLTDRNTLNELKKILEIEGLLDKYGYLFREKARDKRNYYGGLLSLRSRMNASLNMGSELPKMKRDSLSRMVSIPIYFFFKKGTVKLTDKSQLVNLDEIARVCIEHGLTLRIDGAADKATGTKDENKLLSQKRAKYIKKQLADRHVEVEDMKAYAQGGIAQHERPEEDRYGKVAVYIDMR